MTLKNIYDKIIELIKAVEALGEEDPNKVVILKSDTIDSESFNQVLALLRSDNITFSNLKLEDVKLENDEKKLTVAGIAQILGAKRRTVVAIEGEDRTPQKCVVKVDPFGPCKPQTLNALFTIRESIREFPLFGWEFANVSLEANSATLSMTITGKNTQTAELKLLDDLKVTLTGIGFVIENFLRAGLNRIDSGFKVTGTLLIADKNAEVEVELPVARSNRSGAWRLTVKSLDAAPGGIARWLGSESLFDAAPSGILNDSFRLKSLTIYFEGYLGSVGSVQLVMATAPNNKWELAEGLSLTNIEVVVDVDPPFTSPGVSVRVRGQVLVGTVTLNALMTLSARSGQWLISLSTITAGAEFSLMEMSKLPGGSGLQTLGLPPGAETIMVRLIELTIILDLKDPGSKLRSIRLSVATKLEWNIFPDILKISNPQLALELTSQSDPAVLKLRADLGGGLTFLERFQAAFGMGRLEGRWVLVANLLEEIQLSDIGGELGVSKLPVERPEFAKLAACKLTGLNARYTTGTDSQPAEFSFNATVIDALKFSLGDFPIEIPSLSVSLYKAREISVALSAAIRLPAFKNADMALAFTYDKRWKIVIEALGLRGEYDSEKELATIELGSRTFGEVMQTVYSLAEPGRTIRLPEPWNQLEGLSLEGLKFKLYFGKRQPGADSPRFGVDFVFTNGADLVFAKLRKIGFNYMKSGKLKLNVEGSLLGVGGMPGKELNASWDPRNPNAAPPIKLPDGSFINLSFLALGQRLQLRESHNIQRVRDAIELMKKGFDGESPNIFGGADPVLNFNAQSGLLIGAEFTVLSTLAMQLVFNDGTIAGVSIGVNGNRLRYLRSLAFEILYKKVSEGVGVYQIEVRVPDNIRQIELGQVSITIPIVALELYTNGNFRVDLGFPKNNDFSRSFQLQVFPFIGSGGFYFGRLGGVTTRRLPRDSVYKPEAFDPVLVFGIGLRIGVGKNIQRGIFDAELSLCYEGILEGVLAFFNPQKSAPESLYYWLQGTVGIVGRIRGRVIFAVITAEVSLEVAARVGITLESFQPLVLSFKASVSINLVVRIGTGWLSADINCSFYTEISEQFQIPAPNSGIPAWAIEPRKEVQMAPAAPAPFGLMAQSEDEMEKALLSLVSFALADPAPRALSPQAEALRRSDLSPQASQPIPRMTWNPIEIPDGQRGELRLLFRPQFTMVRVDNEQQQIAHGVALLFLQSVGTAHPKAPEPPPGFRPVPPSDFDRFAEAMLLWCVNSLLNRDRIAVSKNEVRALLISAEDLRGIYRALTQSRRGAAPFTAAEVVGFLKNYFDIKIQVEERPPDGVDAKPPSYQKGRPEVAIFPMIPELRLEVTFTRSAANKEYTQLHYAVNFDREAIVPLGYHEEILKYFEQLDSEFRTEVEKDVDKTTADPEPQELPLAGGRSIAEFVFEDYFLLIARGVIQDCLDFMKAYLAAQKTAENDTLAGLASRYRDSIDGIANDHSGAMITPGVEVQIGGGVTITAEGSTFADIAGSFGQPPDGPLVHGIGQANAFVSGLLAAGGIIAVGGGTYEITEFDTLQSVSEALNLDGPGELALEIASIRGYLNADVRLLVPVNPRLYLTAEPQATGDGETVAGLAAFYTGDEAPDADVNRQFVRDLGALNAYLPGLLREGADLAIPGGNVHVVSAGDTLASIATSAELGITPMDILELNLTRDDIFNGNVELEIPPTTIYAEEGDTLASVAAQQGATVSMVADSNAATPGFLASGQTVTVRSIPVSKLIDEYLMVEAPSPTSIQPRTRFNHLAGMASRFLLPGIRLPRPSYLPERVYPLWKTDNPLPLYALTGQQFRLPILEKSVEVAGVRLAAQGAPVFDETYLRCDIELRFPEASNIPMWYEAAIPGFSPEQNKEAKSVVISLKKPELKWIESVRKAKLNAKVDAFSKLPISAITPRRFPLGSRIRLMGPPPVFTFGNAVEEADPTIWAFPEGLRQVISRPGPPLAFRLDKGLLALDNNPDNFPIVRPCSWATALTVTIRRIALSGVAATLPVYEIDGVDAEGLLLLEEILSHAPSVKDVRIYYPSKVDDVPVLISDKTGNNSSFIIQTNLSTLTSLQMAGPITAEGATEQAQFLEMLRKLWQVSIARSGGCYLCYSGAGLPAGVFNDDGVGQVTILVTFGFAGDQVFPFVNRAVVGEATTADSKLFATSVSRRRRITLSSGATIREFLEQYRVSIGDLAKAIAGRPLKAGVIKYYDWAKEPGGTDKWNANLLTLNISQGQTPDGIIEELKQQRVNIHLAELLSVNVNNPALLNLTDKSNFEFPEQLFVKQPKLPPGHVGFVVQRNQPVAPDPLTGLLLPVTNPNAEQQLNYLFSLLGCRVDENQEFSASIEVPADGPEPPMPGEIPVWQYTKVIPALKFLIDRVSAPSGHDPLLPHASRNPYRGAGKRLPVRFEWFDGFGNRTFSPLSPREREDGDQNVYPLSLGYTDELMGVERWPAVSAGYSVRPKENDITKSEIYVQFDFDTARYSGSGNVIRTVGAAKKAARADLEAFRRIYYQLTGGRTEVLLHTTLDGYGVGANNERALIDKQALVDFINSIIAYLVAVVRSNTDQLPRSDQAPRQIVKRQVTLSNSKEIFPLVVKLVIGREDPVDEEFLDAPGVRSVAHEIEPLPVIGGRTGGGPSGAIREFASQFELVFQNTKLATGLARASDVETDSRNRIWVVRTDLQKGVSCAIQPEQQYFFAPVPLATTLLSDPTLLVYNYIEYDTAGGKRHKLESATASYGGIDLDEYARRFVSAIDTALLPQYAAPAYIIERQHYSTILGAKLLIANKIADSVDVIKDAIAADEIGDLAQAQELLRQRLLVQLSAAYEVDTIAQIGVTVTSPYKLSMDQQEGDDPSKLFDSLDEMPKFFGQPVAKLSDTSPEKIDFTLSTAMIPLRNDRSYLTFLFDSKKAMPEQMLEIKLSYDATALEREISDVPGLPGFRASSWLTFINPLEIVKEAQPVIVRVPIPIRAYPIPPTLGNQSVTPSKDPDDPDLQLEETRRYSYSYDYRRLGPGNDLVYTSPRFNAKLSNVAPEDPQNEADLFQALVSFDRVWDQLSRDITTLPDVIKLPGTDPRRLRVLDALAAFAQIASMVANSWGGWPAVRDKKYVRREMPGADEYLYVISERSQGDVNTPWEVRVRKCKDPELKQNAPIPAIEIDGWTREKVETENPNERRFRYKKGEAFLKENEARNISARRVVFEQLDILHKQNAWAGVRMTRNENLFGDRACVAGPPQTNPKFVYQTPMVRFPEILTPLLKCDLEIDIARLPEKPGENPDATTEKPLEGHLARLFERFFESVEANLPNEKTDTRRIQLTCRYQYDLDHPPYDVGDNEGSLPITLPIVMAPPYDFKVRTDYEGCVKNSSSFLCSLSKAIKIWFSGDSQSMGGRYPSRENGRFIFDIAVYSTLGDAGKLPIYRINSLLLMLKDVSDLKEGS